MIKIQLTHSIRAAAAFAVAAVLVGAASASAQTLDTNLFGGTVPTGTPATLTATSLLGSNATTGAFGPGYNGTVSIGLGAATSLNEQITGGTYTITEAGLAGLTGNFTAAKTFAGSSLNAGQFYRLTLATSSVAAVNLLSGFNVQLATTNGGGTTTVILDTSTGVGLAGVTNLVGLFNNNGTETLNFQTPAGLAATPITVTFSGAVSAGALGNSITFTGASIQPVPEPATVALLGAGLLGLTVAVRRRLA